MGIPWGAEFTKPTSCSRHLQIMSCKANFGWLDAVSWGYKSPKNDEKSATHSQQQSAIPNHSPSSPSQQPSLTPIEVIQKPQSIVHTRPLSRKAHRADLGHWAVGCEGVTDQSDQV